MTAEDPQQQLNAEIEVDGDDIVAQVKGSRRDMRRLGAGLEGLTIATAANARATEANARALLKSRTVEVVLGIAVVLSLIAIVLGGASLERLRGCADSLQQYASDNSIRSLILTDGRHDLDAANKRVLLDAFNPGTLTRAQQQARLIEDGKDYTKAAEAYDKLAASHPVPPPPKLTC